MITLQEHLNELDRMVANHASVAEVRSQIAFIAREVSALEAAYLRTIQDNDKLRQAKSEIDSELAKLKIPPTPTVGGFGGTYVDLSTE